MLPTIFDPGDIAADENAEKMVMATLTEAKTNAVVRAPAPSVTEAIMQPKAKRENMFLRKVP
ncbi:hypothetical protein [Tunturiibacter gelidiferens]|uniref:hypothetical protein n=1 Tax=Tunturiibacter gelidiferens TaxID=3069689 RepID=UPI003D9AC823